MANRMWIMVAGPYKTGAQSEEDRARNLQRMNLAAYEVFRKGHVPIIGVNAALPVIEAAGPETYDEVMMPLSLALAERCDGVLRIGGQSSGADDEVNVIRRSGGRVFKNLSDVPTVDREL